jgi:hypothetical protein
MRLHGAMLFVKDLPRMSAFSPEGNIFALSPRS